MSQKGEINVQQFIIRNIRIALFIVYMIIFIMNIKTVKAAAPRLMVTGLKQTDCSLQWGIVQWDDLNKTLNDGHGATYNVYKSKTINGT